MSNQTMNALLHQQKSRMEEARVVLPYICLSLNYSKQDLDAVSSNLSNLAFVKNGFQKASGHTLNTLPSDATRDALSGDELLAYSMLEAFFEWTCLKYAEEALSHQGNPGFRQEHKKARRRKQEAWVNTLPDQESTILLNLLKENTVPIDRLEFMHLLRERLSSEPKFFALNSQGDDYAHQLLFDMMLLTKSRSNGGNTVRGVNVKEGTTAVAGLLRVGAYEMARRKELFDVEKFYGDLTDGDITRIADWTFDLLFRDTPRPFIAIKEDGKNRLMHPMCWQEKQLKVVMQIELIRLRGDQKRTQWLASVDDCTNAGMRPWP